MSHTIYGGKTKNGLYVADMVCDNMDYGWHLNDGRFIRLSCVVDDPETLTNRKPALVLFTAEEPFNPVDAKVLPGTFGDYVDSFFGRPNEKADKEAEAYMLEVLDV